MYLEKGSHNEQEGRAQISRCASGAGGRTRSTSSYYRFITAGRWALPTKNERHARRLGSTVAELRTFYDAVLPRIDAMLAYLNDFPFG